MVSHPPPHYRKYASETMVTIHSDEWDHAEDYAGDCLLSSYTLPRTPPPYGHAPPPQSHTLPFLKCNFCGECVRGWGGAMAHCYEEKHKVGGCLSRVCDFCGEAKRSVAGVVAHTESRHPEKLDTVIRTSGLAAAMTVVHPGGS
jgi:hypothetical protein